MTKFDFKQHHINTPDLLNRFFTYVENNWSIIEDFIIDLETDSEIEKLANIYGMAICFSDSRAFYIQWRNLDGTEVWAETEKNKISDWLVYLAQNKKLVNHNIIYDVLVLKENLGIDLKDYIYSDSILLKHAVNEEPPHGLKEISKMEFGEEALVGQDKLKESIKANGGKWLKDRKDFYKADPYVLGEYANYDVILTYKLYKLYEDRLFKEGLDKLFYEEEIMPLYREVTIPMKEHGFPVDVDHFENLKVEMKKDLDRLEDDILSQVDSKIQKFVQELLDKECPVKPTGNFPKILAEIEGIPLPMVEKKNKETEEKEYKITLAAKALEKQKEQNPEYSWFYDWVISKEENKEIINRKKEVQRKMYFRNEKNQGRRYIFNLASNDHIAYLLFDCLGIKPRKYTDGGKPSTDKDTLEELIESYKSKYPFLQSLSEYKKILKLYTTYVIGILDRQINGVVYTSYLSHGTSSGRYASRAPNLQNLPSIKEEGDLPELVLKYTNSIRKGFKATEGNKVVNADFSRLEVICFADTSGDPKLIESLRNGEDLYSAVAIEVEGLNGYSAKEEDENYLKKHKPSIRSKWKVPPLGIVYGMQENRLMESIGCEFKEARKIINNYLNSYPKLKDYMWKCEYEAKTKGFVRAASGRIRHLPRAKELHEKYGSKLMDYKYAKNKGLAKERRELKNLLNNSKNFPIQNKAANIVNKSAIQINREFKNRGIEGQIRLNTHDELTCIVRENQAKLAAEIMQDKMENTVELSIPLSAEPLIADNWGDAK